MLVLVRWQGPKKWPSPSPNSLRSKLAIGGHVSDIENIIQQLERQRTAIENALVALRVVSGESQPTKPLGRPKGKKRGTTTEGRQRADAMRAHWAAKKAAAEKAAPKKTAKNATKKAGGLTDEGRKILSDNLKRRWAEKRLAAKNSGKKRTAKKAA